jgi:heme-degrading monooxygenase HmoA
MIVREWRAWATPEGYARYEQHFRTAVLPHLREIPGCLDAQLLRRDAESGEIEIVALSYYESLDAIRAFAGDDLERAVVEPAARAVLSRFDERCRHYEVAASLQRC